MKHNKFSIIKRIQSFKHALNGIRILIKEEHNARIHLLVAILVISLSILFQIEKMELLAIIMVIGFVITTETINTAIENICNYISPEKHELIKRIKDISAAAVLIATAIAVIVGVTIFVL